MSRGRSSFGTRLAAFGLATLFAWASSASAALSPTTGPVASVDDREPAPPTNVVAVANIEAPQGEVAWDLSADDFVRQSPAGDDFTSGGTFTNTNDVASYQIWRTAGSEDPAVVATVPAGEMSYVDPDVENGVVYIYAVTAVDAGGNASTPVESEEVTFGPAGKAEYESTQTNKFDFGRVQANADGSTSIVVTNSSTDPEAILIVRASVEGTGFFAFPAKLTLGRGESGSIDVSFASSDVDNINGDYAGILTITTNDPTSSPMVIELSATVFGGVYPEGGPARLLDSNGNEIFGDFDGDASVTFDDFFQFADNFGLTSTSANWDPAFDLSGDDAVTFDDFFIFADNFGKSGTYGSAESTAISFAAALDGTQESTDTGSAGTGFGDFSYTDEDGLTYDITVEGLTGAITAAHFHNGALGVNGEVVHTLTFVEDPAGTWTSSGTWDSSNGLTSALVDELKAGRLYVNVHTAAHESGEIRGQIEE